MIDIEIVTRPNREWASVVANTWRAYRYLGTVCITIPTTTIPEVAAGLRSTDLTIKVWDYPSLSSRPKPSELRG